MPAKMNFPLKKCLACSRQFLVRSIRGLKRQKFCSRECLGFYSGSQRHEKGVLTAVLRKPKGIKDTYKPRPCQCCEQSFVPTSGRQRWCRVCCPGPTWKGRLQRYGISKPMWDSMVRQQNGMCALCDKPPAAVDHDHGTGKVRGLLCTGCNFKLVGLDDPEWRAKAEVYRACT